MLKKAIAAKTGNAGVDLALDTVALGKQALIFVNTKRGAERLAEDIAKKLDTRNAKLHDISRAVEKAISNPTKQCKRLAKVVQKGSAFHHAGLVAKQRELVEDNFKSGNIKIICSTPSLAMGVNLPAFRAIIRDLRRYSHRGLQYIPVLEYLQMSGRAGRPQFDDFGETIIVAGSEHEKDVLYEKYMLGEPEDIYSKLAVEPVLRTYVLSLIATNFVNSKEKLLQFFGKTFWAHQFMDLSKISSIIDKMLQLLDDWEFIIISGKKDFTSADELQHETIKATPLGKRIAELYVDPLTAFEIIKSLRKASDTKYNSFSFLHMVSHTLEMRPLLRVGVKEQDLVHDFILRNGAYILEPEPSIYEPEYDEYLNSIKTAMMLYEWIDEKNEEYILEEYKCRPGEIKGKLDIADWLLYTAEELSRLLTFQYLQKEFVKLRLRLKHGIKEELLPLIRLKGIGRVRARAMFNNGIKDVKALKQVDVSKLAYLIGAKVAVAVKEQVGEKVTEIPKGRRKGQIRLDKF